MMKQFKSKLKQLIKEVKQEQSIKESQFAATAAEEAVKVNSQVPGMALQTDQSYWAKHGVNTGEDLAKELLASSYSDLYKSIHGIRPRWKNFKDMSVEEIQAEIDNLYTSAESYVDEDEIQYPQEEYEEPEEFYDEMSETEPEDEYDRHPAQSGMGRRMREHDYIKQTILDVLKTEDIKDLLP